MVAANTEKLCGSWERMGRSCSRAEELNWYIYLGHNFPKHMGSEKHACLLPFPLSYRAVGHLCHLKRPPLKRTSKPLSLSAMALMGNSRGQSMARTGAESALGFFFLGVYES